MANLPSTKDNSPTRMRGNRYPMDLRCGEIHIDMHVHRNIPPNVPKRFYFWLAGQPGYKARLRYSDAEDFNLSEKGKRIATAQQARDEPSSCRADRRVVLIYDS